MFLTFQWPDQKVFSAQMIRSHINKMEVNPVQSGEAFRIDIVKGSGLVSASPVLFTKKARDPEKKLHLPKTCFADLAFVECSIAAPQKMQYCTEA